MTRVYRSKGDKHVLVIAMYEDLKQFYPIKPRKMAVRCPRGPGQDYWFAMMGWKLEPRHYVIFKLAMEQHLAKKQP